MLAVFVSVDQFSIHTGRQLDTIQGRMREAFRQFFVRCRLINWSHGLHCKKLV